MNDLIRREDVMVLWDKYHYEIATKAIEYDKDLRAIPSVEPKKGKWIDFSDEGFVECPYCHSATNCDGNKEELHYCYSCGADMRESE